MTFAAVSKWERGLATPDLELIVQMANIFDISRVIGKSQKSNGNMNIIKKLRYKAIPLFVIDYKNNKKLKNSMSIKIYDIKWQKNHSLKFNFTMHDFAMITLYSLVLILTIIEEV